MKNANSIFPDEFVSRTFGGMESCSFIYSVWWVCRKKWLWGRWCPVETMQTTLFLSHRYHGWWNECVSNCSMISWLKKRKAKTLKLFWYHLHQLRRQLLVMMHYWESPQPTNDENTELTRLCVSVVTIGVNVAAPCFGGDVWHGGRSRSIRWVHVCAGIENDTDKWLLKKMVQVYLRQGVGWRFPIQLQWGRLQMQM